MVLKYLKKQLHKRKNADVHFHNSPLQTHKELKACYTRRWVFVHHQWKNQTFRELLNQKTKMLLAILACTKAYLTFLWIWGFMKTHRNWPFKQLVIKRSAHNGKKILLVIQIFKKPSTSLIQAKDMVARPNTKHMEVNQIYIPPHVEALEKHHESENEKDRVREIREKQRNNFHEKPPAFPWTLHREISKMWTRSEVWFTERKI